MAEIYWTSDTHFGHRGVIEHSKRPFASVEEMDEGLIANWNAVVKAADTIYHLGDFGFSGRTRLQAILDRLNGHKHLCPGNHDKLAVKLTGWETVRHLRELKLGDRRIVMLHYGMRVWNRSHYGAIQLYGHSHGSLPGNDQSLDVGTDCWDYRPVSLEQILGRLATLPPYRQPDHHASAALVEAMS